jgi:pimeloyl-ACP methyl ester carboxylesterase
MSTAANHTTRASHSSSVPAVEARLSDVTAPAPVVMGEQDPGFPDPRAEADWIVRALRAQVVMVPEAGHYPQSQRPTSPPAQSCASWNRSRAVPRQARMSVQAGRIAGEVAAPQSRK